MLFSFFTRSALTFLNALLLKPIGHERTELALLLFVTLILDASPIIKQQKFPTTGHWPHDFSHGRQVPQGEAVLTHQGLPLLSVCASVSGVLAQRIASVTGQQPVKRNDLSVSG